jgi:hypothetical protein
MDPRVVDPGHAPTPFTADEIRDGSPDGRTVLVQHQYPNDDPQFWRTRFVASDQNGPEVVNQQVEADGTSIGPETRMRVTWDELQAHASFPKAATTIEEATTRTPLGDLDCLLYTVSDGVEEKRLWFAKSLPGMPVRTQHLTNGVETASTMVIADTAARTRD